MGMDGAGDYWGTGNKQTNEKELWCSENLKKKQNPEVKREYKQKVSFVTKKKDSGRAPL